MSKFEHKINEVLSYHDRPTLREFLIAFTTTVIVAGVCYPLSGAIGYQTVGLIFLMTISVLSLFLGRAALIFAAILNFGVWNFFFIQPLYTFRVHSFHDLIALFTNLMVAIAASALISRIRASQTTIQKSQERLILLHHFLESLNNAISIKDVVKRTNDGMKENFGAEVILYLKMKKGKGLSPRPFGNEKLNENSVFQAAQLCFRDSTEERSASYQNKNIWLYPLKEPRLSLGVIGIVFPENHPPDEEKLILLKSFIAQIASALDREISIDMVKEKEISTESEKLFQTVLNSVSHELKTPISIISAAVSNLNDPLTSSEPLLRKQIGEELEIASVRLNHLVENILDMSRIESGLLRLNMQICDVADLIGIVVHELRTEDHKITINTQDSIPFIHADINLLRQALINILHNALVYTPVGSVIILEAESISENEVCIRVLDEGTGIPEESISRLFEKFYRVPGSKSGGTGLGLTIARAIAELHGGSVMARNRKERGLEVIMTLKTHHGQQSEI